MIFLLFYTLIMSSLLSAQEVDTQDIYSFTTYPQVALKCRFNPTKTTPSDSTTPLPLTSNIQKKYPISLSQTFEQAENASFLEKLSEAFFKNEANCKTKNLTFWGTNENFPSLGLLHALWMPRDSQEIYQEQFLPMIQFIEQQLASDAKLKTLKAPHWVHKNVAAPWSSKTEFDKILAVSLKMEKALDSSQLYEIKQTNAKEYLEAFRLLELRHFLSLAPVLHLQTLFSLRQAQQSLWNILAHSEGQSTKLAERLYTNIQQLLKTPEGFLSMIDYLNFKGDGLNPKETTPLGHYSWGLKDVLESMDDIKIQSSECDANNPSCANHKFSEAALCHLQRVAKFSGEDDSPEQIQRYKWLNGGWKTRVEQNYRPFTFNNPRCYQPPQFQTQSSLQESK